jgi:hypothetical protein
MKFLCGKICIIALLASIAPASAVRAAATIAFDSDVYTVRSGDILAVQIHFDADDSTSIFDSPQTGLRHFGFQLYSRWIQSATPVPELDFQGAMPGAAVTIFPDSSQIRGDASPALAEGYLGTLMGTFTIEIPADRRNGFSIAADVIEAFESDSGVILPRSGITVSDRARVTIVPEPAASQLILWTLLNFSCSRAMGSRSSNG